MNTKKSYSVEIKKEIGARLKKEAGLHNLKRSEMRELLAYEKEESVSAVYSGKQTPTPDKIKKLAETWGLRENYLICADDWRTEDDKLSALHAENTKEYRVVIDFFRYIGVNLELAPFMTIPVPLLLSHKDVLLPYFTEDEKRRIPVLEKIENTQRKENPVEYEQYSSDTPENNEYNSIIIRLKNIPPDTFYKPNEFESTLYDGVPIEGDNDDIIDKKIYSGVAINNKLIKDRLLFIHNFYIVTIDNKYKGLSRVSDINRFLIGIQNSTKEMSISLLTYQGLLMNHNDDYEKPRRLMEIEED